MAQNLNKLVQVLACYKIGELKELNSFTCLSKVWMVTKNSQ